MDNSRVDADARRLVESLGPLPAPEAPPVFIMVSGLPGTGKSYLSRRLAERLSYPVLESDALRKQLFPAPTYSAMESGILFRAIHKLMEKMLGKGIPVIMDATNLTERYRRVLYNIAEKHNARLILVRTRAPLAIVRERLRSRTGEKRDGDKSDADWEVYRKLSTTAETIRRQHFVVDTSKDITPAVDKIVREATNGRR
jgi:predicted kinase